MLMIGTDDGIYRWFEGAPWPIFHALQNRSIVGLASPGGGVRVALDDAAKVWESLDNGLNWRSIPAPQGAGRAASVAMLPGGEIVLATGRPLGLFRRPVGVAAPTDAPGAIARAKNLEDLVIGRARALTSRFRKGGGTATLEPPAARADGWIAMTAPSASAGPAAPAVRFVASEAGAVYASVAGAGLWRSGDLGASWDAVAGLPPDVYALRFSGQTAVAGTSDGVKLSADGGATWADASAGLENARQVRAVAIKPGEPKRLLAGAAPKGAGEGPVASRGGLGFALYESKDAGKTWAHVARGFPEVLETDAIADIRHMPEEPARAVVSLASGEMWSTPTDGLWWEPLARQIRGVRAVCVAG